MKKIEIRYSKFEIRKVKRVKIYSIQSCPFCVMEKMWLKEKGIEFEESLIDINPIEAQKMIEKTGQMGVSVTEIEYEEKLERSLGI